MTIFILGRGRCGTSMIASILHEAGFDVAGDYSEPRVQGYFEASRDPDWKHGVEYMIEHRPNLVLKDYNLIEKAHLADKVIKCHRLDGSAQLASLQKAVSKKVTIKEIAEYDAKMENIEGLDVYYEDVLKRPSEEIKRLCKFVGIRYRRTLKDVVQKDLKHF